MTQILGLLSHYDEPPHLLAAAVTSLTRAGVDHLIACDGAYALYGGGRNHSGALSDLAILEAAHAAGMGVTLHTPQTVWYGNEVEKRSAMFAIAEQIAEPNDWYIVMDADQIVTQAPHDLKQQLANTKHDAAEVTFWERTDLKQAYEFDMPREHQTRVRILFRAIPGLRCHVNHYTYRTPDGRDLWGQDGSPTLTDSLDLGQLVHVEHRPNLRPVARAQAKRDYYRKREQLGIELGQCDRCEQPATRTMPTSFEPGEGDTLQAGGVAVCQACAATVQAENEQTIRDLGGDAANLARVV